MIQSIVKIEFLDRSPMPQILASPRIVNQDVPHLPRSDVQKMKPILAAQRLAGKKCKIQLIYQSGGLQAAFVSFPANTLCGELVELLVDGADQLPAGFFITVSPLGEQ